MFCRLQVAGWNLIITRKPLALRGNVQAVDLPWLLQDAVYDCSVRLLPNNAKLAEVMAGGYIPMISSLKWIVSFEEASEISSEIAAEFGFFPVNTKMKAQWACANLPSVKILYYFISLFMFGNLLLLSEEPSQIWNRSKYLWSDHPDGFEENFHGDFTGVSVSIDNDLSQIESKINNFTFKESDTHYYGRRECSS